MTAEVKALSSPASNEHVAPCGLFCTNCGKFKKGSCRGCQVEPGFSRCAVRLCCQERGITGCWECLDFKAPRDYRECRKVNNAIAKIFALLFKSDRPGALLLLRDRSRAAFLEARRKSGKM